MLPGCFWKHFVSILLCWLFHKHSLIPVKGKHLNLFLQSKEGCIKRNVKQDCARNFTFSISFWHLLECMEPMNHNTVSQAVKTWLWTFPEMESVAKAHIQGVGEIYFSSYNSLVSWNSALNKCSSYYWNLILLVVFHNSQLWIHNNSIIDLNNIVQDEIFNDDKTTISKVDSALSFLPHKTTVVYSLGLCRGYKAMAHYQVWYLKANRFSALSDFPSMKIKTKPKKHAETNKPQTNKKYNKNPKAYPIYLKNK